MGHSLRIKQEILLGIGGIRLLDTIDAHPEVYHLNEGHHGIPYLRTRDSGTLRNRVPMSKAWEEVREKCVFTTHTPVPAGHSQILLE